MSYTYQIMVNYTHGKVTATCDMDGTQGDLKPWPVKEGSLVQFNFNGPGELVEAVLLSGQMGAQKSSSPFKEGNHINLQIHPQLTLADTHGLWGFSIAFSARNEDDTTSFYFLPDPELQVGSTSSTS